MPSCNVPTQSLLTTNKSMPNVPAMRNLIFDDEMAKSMDFGPIPLTQIDLDHPHVFDLTQDDIQTVEEQTAAQTVATMSTAAIQKSALSQTGAESVAMAQTGGATPALTQTGTETETEAQKSALAQTGAETVAPKIAMSQTVRPAYKKFKKTHVAGSLLMNMEHGYFPVVYSAAAPESYVAIEQLPLHSMDMNSSTTDSTMDMTVPDEDVQLLPGHVYEDVLNKTISSQNKALFLSRNRALFEMSEADSNEALIAKAEALGVVAEAVVPKNYAQVDKSNFDVFEDDSGDEDLPSICPTSKEVLRAVSMHSYRKACRCTIDRKLSSGRRKVYNCATHGKDTIGGKDKKVQCVYKIIYRIVVKGSATWWELDKKESTWQHAIGCQSVPKMSADNLVNNPAFRKVVLDNKSVKIKNLQRASLGPGIIRTSMSNRKLYRAKDQILLNNASDYKDRFNKLHQWGEEHCKKNPGSMFSIMRDDGRLASVSTTCASNIVPRT